MKNANQYTVARLVTHETAGKSKGIQYDNIPGIDSGPVSVAFWAMRVETQTVDQHMMVVDQTASDADDGGVGFIQDGSPGTGMLFVIRGTLDADVEDANTPLVNTGVWVHYVGTYGGVFGTSDPKIYRNGVNVGSSTTAGSGSRSSAPGSHSIGGRESTVERGAGCVIAGVGRWQRELSPAEVKLLANGMHPLDMHSKDLVLCPNFLTLENMAPGAARQSLYPNLIEQDGLSSGPPVLRPPKARQPRFALTDPLPQTRSLHVPDVLPWHVHEELTFYWSMESETLGAGDFSMGDKVPADLGNANAVINSDTVRVGGSSLDSIDSNSGFEFATDADLIRYIGTVGFWYYIEVWPGDTTAMWFAGEGDSSSYMSIRTVGVVGGSGNIGYRVENNAGGQTNVITTGANLDAGNWYYIKASWHIPRKWGKITVYDTNLIELATNENRNIQSDHLPLPDEFATMNFYNSQVTGHYDNAIISRYWDAPLEKNALITDITQYQPMFSKGDLHVPYEYEELTFDDKEERLFMIPQRARKQPR